MSHARFYPRGRATRRNSMFIAGPIFLISFTLGFIVLNFIFAEFAGRNFGRQWQWLLAFFVLPLLAHLFFLYLLWHARIKERELRAMQKGLMLTDKDRPQYADDKPKGDSSVTPFGMDSAEEEKSGNEPTDILFELRDKKIDELMEWKEWAKAYELALERLEESENLRDRRSIKLYEAYVRLLKPRVRPVN